MFRFPFPQSSLQGARPSRLCSWVLALLLPPAIASAQVTTSDAAWCEVMEQALADQGIQADVRSDISDAKTVHVTVNGQTRRYELPTSFSRQDYSSPVYVMIDALTPPLMPVTIGHGRMDGRLWMGRRTGLYLPHEVYINPYDADALQASIRTTVSAMPRISLVDGEFTSAALSSGVPLLIMKGTLVASQRGEQFRKGSPGQRGPQAVERWFAYARVHVELTDYRTGEIIWTDDLQDENYTSIYSSDPMESVHRSISSAIQRKLATLFPSTAPRPSIGGSILSVAEQKKDKAERVYVNLGTSHELRPGDDLIVYAPVQQNGNLGSTPIGTLSVAEVQGPTLALCKVKKGGKEMLTAIQQGATLAVQSKW